MDIREKIMDILNNYPVSKNCKNNTNFKNNRLVSSLRIGLNDFNNYSFNGQTFISKGSAGQGRWATIPWIGVFSEAISITAESGFDIVYLFSEDMKSVYLSLNQGWNLFKKIYKDKNIAKKKIESVANYWQENLVYDERFTTQKINICRTTKNKLNTDLPAGYEYGNILSIRYDANKIPDNFNLENDLKLMIALLYQLQMKLVDPQNVEASINILLQKQSDSEIIRENSNAQSSELKTVLAPQKGLPKYEYTGKVTKSDIEKKNTTRKALGDSGEKLVINFEKNKLLENNKIELATKVKHSSISDGDGLGYDITSYETDGKKIYIEVKSTTGDINTPFYISRNELSASQKFGESYKLYRVFNLGGKNTPQVYIINGDLNKNLRLNAVDYEALPK